MAKIEWAPLPQSMQNPTQPQTVVTKGPNPPQPAYNNVLTNPPAPKRGGRPRKYTGEPWDSMDDETYKKEAKKEHNRESNFTRKSKMVPQNFYPMPLDRSNITPMLHMEVPAAREAYQAYINGQHAINIGVDSFVKWASAQKEYVEALRLKYMSIIIPLGFKESVPDVEPDTLSNYKWDDKS
jgi:hypothetical protein